MESEGITSENVPREAVEDIMTSNAVLRQVGSLAELRAVPSSVPGNVYSRYLQGISAGWYSTVQYLGTETCARDVAYSVVSIRTNTCFSNGDVKGIPTSIYISCTTASSSITTYTASNACEGPAVTVTEPLKCYDREGEIATDDYFHGDTSYLTTCAIGSEPNIPGTYAGTM